MIKLVNKEFKTKKELEFFTRSFLEKNDGATIKEGEHGFNFLSDLVKRHPEKKTKIIGKIKLFKIERNFGGHIALSLQDEKEYKSISWIKCITAKKSDSLASLKAACRQAVTDQVQEYKTENYYDDMPCPSCGKPISERKKAHVDHKTRSFMDLFNEFTGKQDKLPTEFRSLGNHLCHIFKDEDAIMHEAWKQYHLDNADYQILCASCNIKKK